MTVVARLNSLKDAYQTLSKLRARSIFAGLAHWGGKYLIGVENEHRDLANLVLAGDVTFGPEEPADPRDDPYEWDDFENQNN